MMITCLHPVSKVSTERIKHGVPSVKGQFIGFSGDKLYLATKWKYLEMDIPAQSFNVAAHGPAVFSS
jgi:hypothetical protein